MQCDSAFGDSGEECVVDDSIDSGDYEDSVSTEVSIEEVDIEFRIQGMTSVSSSNPFGASALSGRDSVGKG
jgi:hypothetical protein